MPIDFPTSPTVGQVYTFGSRSWEWTGNGWMAVSAAYGPTGPTGPTGPAGAVTQIVAGSNITISPTGGTGAVTINSSGGGSSGDSDQTILPVQIFS